MQEHELLIVHTYTYATAVLFIDSRRTYVDSSNAVLSWSTGVGLLALSFNHNERFEAMSLVHRKWDHTYTYVGGYIAMTTPEIILTNM